MIDRTDIVKVIGRINVVLIVPEITKGIVTMAAILIKATRLDELTLRMSMSPRIAKPRK